MADDGGGRQRGDMVRQPRQEFVCKKPRISNRQREIERERKQFQSARAVKNTDREEVWGVRRISYVVRGE